MIVVIVGNLLLVVLTSVITREFTLEKGLINAVTVGKLSLLVPSSVLTRDFTLEKGLMSAVNVASPSSKEIP